jgi:prefoldin alpha subunit
MENNQELLFKLSMFEQQMNQLQQQLQAVEQGILELGTLNIGLKELENGEGKEIFAPVGRGIFAKAKLISNDLVVDIGNKNFVKKNIPETQSIIKKQIEKLENAKEELNMGLEMMSNEAEKIISESQKN